VTKKRKSGGRSKGKKGVSGTVQCSSCNKTVPRDKAKKKTRYKSLVDPTIYKELRKSGAVIPRVQTTEYYCINCAVHRGVTNIRAKSDRKSRR
jgi:small subunit ribosomal protein S26e